MCALEKLEEVLRNIKKQRTYGVRLLIYLQDWVGDSDRFDEFQGRKAMWVDALIADSIEEALILFCSRMWDSRADSTSLRVAWELVRENMSQLEEALNSHKFGKNDAVGLDFKAEIERVDGRIRELRDSEAYGVIRVIRTENLAHRLSDSRDRRTAGFLTREDYDNHGVTLGDFLDFAEETIDVMDDISFLMGSSNSDRSKSARFFQEFLDVYWKIARANGAIDGN
ncbi:MAG: AbiU2 domain-containing protein [Marinibacterium sp.]